ncbi:hypothetical protein COV17_02550 [Candidatus Woesearchaeota archaeon CG10_big_fil_rev_8_21_14_0_10_36_11]|nr:MAG: hypothetical protein COV17_02550 [Candidatus Woesearchaeota archaeon CG10_big_fil_rev_8_21_14_0_10_36_11]
MDVVLILLVVSLVLFFGFFAEFIFRKINIPDVLFLIILGFVLGPHILNVINPNSFIGIASIFTTFTLLFLLFDGAFNINLASLVREFSQSFVLTLFNFFVSTVVVTLIMLVVSIWIDGISFTIALLTGFILGGVSSSFAIPVLKGMKVGEKLYSLLTLESALTDVFCIVFSLTILEIMRLGSFGVQGVLVQLISLFAVAGIVGLVGGVVWIFLVLRVFKEHNYMITIAYLLLIYASTEFLGGNGAIAALFFGLVLKNSKQLSSIIHGITTTKASEKKKALKGDLGVSITTPSEQHFYHQISFFLKTFFFVYVGVLIDISDWKALLIGGIIAVVIMFSRMGSFVLTKKMDSNHKAVVNAIFARGLAAAAVAHLALQAGIPIAGFLVRIVYVTITGTILLSSIKVFIVKKHMPNLIKEIKSKIKPKAKAR